MKKILLLTILFVTGNLFSQTTFTSSQSGYWDNEATWGSVGAVPSNSDTAVINFGATVIVRDNPVTVDKLTLTDGTLKVRSLLTVSNSNGDSSTASGTSLILEEADMVISDNNFENAGDITIGAEESLVFSSGGGDTFTNTGSVTITSNSQSFGSVVFTGTYSGNTNAMIYSRFVEGADGEWDLIGPPLNGMNIATFITSNSDIAENPNNSDYGIGTYNNGNNSWSTFSTSDVEFDNFAVGSGYQMATNNGSNIEFRGTLQTSNLTKSINSNESNPPADDGGTRYNLIANPFPAYLNANFQAGANNFLSTNLTQFDPLSHHQVLWAWNGAAGEYVSITNASGARYIAPGQAFIVSSKSNGGNVQFRTNMINTSASGDDFYIGDALEENRAELFISLDQSNNFKTTEIYFIDEGGSDGIDPGYDGALLPIADNSFSIYTRTLQEDNGENLAVNALNFFEISQKIIPLGITALATEEVIISISHNTVPADINIYLEDAFANTLTDLRNENFIFSPVSDLDGIGRFFIHITEDTMSDIDLTSNFINVYKEANSEFITIEGLYSQNGEINISLFNILGHKVLSASFDNSLNERYISTQGISQGIYIVELESSVSRVTKKILIK